MLRNITLTRPIWLHMWFGYIATILVILRVVWGFVGPEYARFANFVRGPRLIFGYLFDLIRIFEALFRTQSGTRRNDYCATFHGRGHGRNRHGRSCSRSR